MGTWATAAAILAFCIFEVVLPARCQELNLTSTVEPPTPTPTPTPAEPHSLGVMTMTGGLNSTLEGSPCRARMINLTMTCANLTGASQEDVDMAMKMEIPSSEAGKCLTKCMLKARGMMTPEGAFAVNGTVDFLTEAYKNETLREEFERLGDYCYEKLKVQPMEKLDTCQFAYDIATCTEEFQKTLFLRNPAMAPPVNAITTP